MIRFEYYLRRQPHVSSEGFQVAWQDGLQTAWLDVLNSLGCLRALAVLGQHNDLFDQMNHARGGSMQAPFDLVVELWWTTDAEAVRALTGGGLERLADLVAAQAVWLDATRSPAWLAMEYPQVNPTPEDLLASAGGVLKKLQFPLQHRRDQGAYPVSDVPTRRLYQHPASDHFCGRTLSLCFLPIATRTAQVTPLGGDAHQYLAKQCQNQ